jgi:plastocyanin
VRVLFIALAATVLVIGAPVVPARTTGAQSLLDRSDNVSGDWIGNTGTVYFNFTHRFSASPPPERKVSNFPTFLIATGIASRALVGLNYATNSVLVPRYPNEFEFFARYAPWQQEEGRPLDIGGQVDYNLAVKGVDGELSLGRRQGPLHVIAVGRLLADTIQGGTTHFAVGGGGTIRLMRYIALAGDAATMTNHGSGSSVVWSAGVHLALPNTPHTLSIHVSNANTATLQGLSRGGGVRRYGFEFTIPVTLSRFFHPDQAVPTSAPPAAGSAPAPVPGAATAPTSAAAVTPTAASPLDSTRARSAPANAPAAAAVAASPTPASAKPVSPTPASSPATPAARPTSPGAAPARAAASQPAPRPEPTTVRARLKGLSFVPSRIEIAAGTTVQWTNLDPLLHTVTAVDQSFTSPPFGLEKTYRHTFTKPGTYAVYCALHPNMKATVVVK